MEEDDDEAFDEKMELLTAQLGEHIARGAELNAVIREKLEAVVMDCDWEQTTIDQLGRIVTGKTPPTENREFFGGNVPFLTPSDMADGFRRVKASRTLTNSGLLQVKNCLVPRGVAVSCIGWQMGKTVLVEAPTVTNQQINTIIVDETRVDLLFVYYLLSSMREEIFQRGSTATRTPILNKGDFGRLKIRLPTLRNNAP